MKVKSKNKKEQVIINQDDLLLEKIQPKGGISFKDVKYIVTGNGYETCIHIYEFPKSLDDYWMARVCNINNTVVTVDISTDNINEVMKNINKSMKEQQYRYYEATDFQEQFDAQRRYQEMENLYDEISSMGEVVKLLHVRIFVADRSLAELEEKTKNIMAKLESNGFMPTIFLNETKTEWMSMFRSYNKQNEELFSLYGQPLTSNAVAAGDPFHFSCLEDSTGTFLGKTPCGGNVIFDEFLKTKTRLYYNSLCVGTMGSGKSTLLKKRFLANAIMGNYVRTFDISGEFGTLTKTLGGKVIKLDGSNGILNPLEILRAGDDDMVSFTRHISKVSTIYKFLAGGDVDTEEIIEFEEVLRELYQKFGMYVENGKMAKPCTGLQASEYPIIGELDDYVFDKIKKMQQGSYEDAEIVLVQKNMLQLNKIHKILQNVVNTYGNLFNGHTSIDNILDEQIVTFDISTLKEMKAEIFDAQIFNMVSLCWDNCVTNGKLMLDKVYKKTIKDWDIVKFLILIDESHRWINTQKPHALDLITVYLREARKYFGGITLASQSIRDYVPEGEDSSDAFNKIKTVFELTQYKFIFHQDSNVVSMLNNIFDGVLTPSQISRIPKLGVGENILCIASDRNLEFKVHLTEEEEQIFQGGI